ncbi:MAG TPA: hypothetical protein DDZ42_01265 [Candidatus Rokubacteria bacterium]|nr:hypothetical protein [Candidatus Rokubacteria bacterium]
MTRSPKYLATVPPFRKTISVISVMYSWSIATTSSAPTRWAMAVKPRMSEKSTVTSRRVEPSARSGSRTISRTTAGEKNRARRRRSRCART